MLPLWHIISEKAGIDVGKMWNDILLLPQTPDYKYRVTENELKALKDLEEIEIHGMETQIDAQQASIKQINRFLYNIGVSGARVITNHANQPVLKGGTNFPIPE